MDSMSAQRTSLALFDFDGTITRKDSLAEFVAFGVGKARFILGLILLAPVLVAYKLGFVSNHAAKRRLLAHFFGGWDADRFRALAQRYAVERIDLIVRPLAMDKIAAHRGQGHRVAVVSASMESWLKAWCDKHGLDLIATRLEVRDRKLTGEFATPNCYGPEKERRVRERYDLDAFDVVYAYGDSRGDREMLALADEATYRPFR